MTTPQQPRDLSNVTDRYVDVVGQLDELLTDIERSRSLVHIRGLAAAGLSLIATLRRLDTVDPDLPKHRPAVDVEAEARIEQYRAECGAPWSA